MKFNSFYLLFVIECAAGDKNNLNKLADTGIEEKHILAISNVINSGEDDDKKKIRKDYVEKAFEYLKNVKENEPIKNSNINKDESGKIDLSNKIIWQTQFDSKWGNIDSQKVACKRTCDDILNKQGLENTSKDNLYQTALEKDKHKRLEIDKEISKLAISYIDNELKNGYPVEVGVDHDLNYRGGSLNEGTTDHFIVIIGKEIKNKKVYYRFYDVATRFKEKGTSEENKLLLNEVDYSLKGKTKYNGRNYTVTQVRKNKKKIIKK